MFNLPLETKVWLASEIRIWGLAAAAILAFISFGATWAQTRLQAQLSEQKEEASNQRDRKSQERIAHAQAEAAEANARAAEATRLTEQERLARVKIEGRLADRALSDVQFTTISNELRPFAGQEYEITTFWDLREPMAISNRISHALTSGGWKYVKPDKGRWLIGGLEGVEIYVHPDANERTKGAADALFKSLTAANISTKLKQKNAPNTPDNMLTLNIGTKPQ